MARRHIKPKMIAPDLTVLNSILPLPFLSFLLLFSSTFFSFSCSLFYIFMLRIKKPSADILTPERGGGAVYQCVSTAIPHFPFLPACELWGYANILGQVVNVQLSFNLQHAQHDDRRCLPTLQAQWEARMRHPGSLLYRRRGWCRGWSRPGPGRWSACWQETGRWSSGGGWCLPPPPPSEYRQDY